MYGICLVLLFLRNTHRLFKRTNANSHGAAFSMQRAAKQAKSTACSPIRQNWKLAAGGYCLPRGQRTQQLETRAPAASARFRRPGESTCCPAHRNRKRLRAASANTVPVPRKPHSRLIHGYTRLAPHSVQAHVLERPSQKAVMPSRLSKAG
jgi:hypothetical protein